MTPRLALFLLSLAALAGAVALMVTAQNVSVRELRMEPHDCVVVQRDQVGRASEFECRPVEHQEGP